MTHEEMASLAREITRDADEFKKLIRVRDILDTMPGLKTEKAISDHDIRIEARVLLANLDVGPLETALRLAIQRMWPQIMEKLERDLYEEIARIEQRWKDAL